MKKNLIGKTLGIFAMAAISVMACLCACTMPAGVPAASDAFIAQITDDSDYTEGFRNVRQIFKEAEAKEIINVFGLSWEASKDCKEERDVDGTSLESLFQPKENGLYEMEVVAVDIFGNASTAKVFVLYDHAEKSAIENHAKSNGFDRRKAEEAFVKVNEQRIASGAVALVWDETLYELAGIRAQELVSSFSHQRPDGSYVGDVMVDQYGFYYHNGSCYWVNLFRS